MADRLNHTSNAQPIKVEPTRKLCTELAEVVLFPRQSYEAEFIQPRNSIGFAFDAQLGEHAIGSDQITPFFATANSLAYIPAGCDIYSRSRTGGEYLKICLSPDPVDFDAITPKPIPFNNVISSQAVRMANRLRMAILGGTKPDAFWVELVLQNMLRTVAAEYQNFPTAEYRSAKLGCVRSRILSEWIEEHLGESLTVGRMARYCALSPGYFARAFKAQFGVTPHEYVLSRRIQKARNALCKEGRNLSEIALACGFASHAHMSAAFTARLGISPSALIREKHNTVYPSVL
ncbi:MAG: AraC family transcriptional regulator [Pseudomonadales bacterium]|nr:AraC family transcriptional regulator [Pseudomonadales bacterium]